MKTLKCILAYNIIASAIQLIHFFVTPVRNETEGYGVAIGIVLYLLYTGANIFAWRRVYLLQVGFTFVSQMHDSAVSAMNAYARCNSKNNASLGSEAR
jgi:hypothetical protein